MSIDGMQQTRFVPPLMPSIRRAKRIAIVRDYRPDDLEAVVMLFQRLVREVASRDYPPAQIFAWAPKAPDLEAWARRLRTGGVFVYERDDQIAGFARVDVTGCVDLLYVHPEVQAKVWLVRWLIE